MTTIITRSGKGSALTHAEMDGNLTALRDTADAAATGGALTAHTGSTSNPHSVTKAQVGLGNVDNTADASKPVSAAQATAIVAAVTAHESASDPHPQYLTEADGSSLYAPATVTGVVNLGVSASPTGVTVTSDTGNDAVIPLADTTNAGAMAPAQVTKLAGVAAGATANATDAQLRDRSTHTGTQATSTVTGLDAALSGKATTAQGAKADTALQPGVLPAGTTIPLAQVTGAGTAAAQASTAFATAAQGTLAGTALQPSAQLTQAAVTSATAAGVALLDAADAAAQRSALGLGTAATTPATAYATATQGAKADTALQDLPGMQTAFAAGTPARQAAFQASVSGAGAISTLPAPPTGYVGKQLPPMNFNPGGRFSIVLLGDSIGAGAWANTTASQWALTGWAAQLRSKMAARGYVDGGQGFIPLSDPVYTVTGTWNQIPNSGPSGDLFYATGITNKYSVTTVTACDNIDVLYLCAGSSGTFTVSVDGGAPISIVPPSVDNQAKSFNIAGLSLGTHTIEITAPASGYVYFIGFAAYVGKAGFVLHNISRSGAVANNFGYNAATRLELLRVLKPRVTFIATLANDYSTQVAVSTYRGAIDAQIVEALKYGNVIGWIPPATSSVYAIPVTTYEAEQKAALLANGSGSISVRDAWGTYAANIGKMYDTLHPNLAGHIAIADLVLQELISLGA